MEIATIAVRLFVVGFAAMFTLLLFVDERRKYAVIKAGSGALALSFAMAVLSAYIEDLPLDAIWVAASSVTVLALAADKFRKNLFGLLLIGLLAVSLHAGLQIFTLSLVAALGTAVGIVGFPVLMMLMALGALLVRKKIPYSISEEILLFRKGPAVAAGLTTSAAAAIQMYILHALLPTADAFGAPAFAAIAVVIQLGTMISLLYIYQYQHAVREMALKEANIDVMQSFLNTIRGQRHDMSLHVHVLTDLIRQEEYVKCVEYLNTLAEDIETINTLIPIRDPSIAALINQFRAKCNSAGIPLHIDIRDDLTGIDCNAYDLNKVLGNLLQNALEEVSCSDDPVKAYGISVEMFKRAKTTVIRISNKTNNPTAMKNFATSGYSGKEGHEGIGVNVAKQIVEQHSGLFYWELLENQVISFVVKLPRRNLRVKEEEEGVQT